jgi:hypothetical protein
LLEEKIGKKFLYNRLANGIKTILYLWAW